MIYFISDIHGGESMRGLKKYLSFCNASDILIILGDVGLKFENTEENKKFTEYFEGLDANIAFVDGNHENHAYINSFDEDDYCGGKINRISSKIIHLQRGNIYEIEGKTFFVMGGCKSSAKWKEKGLYYDGEEPSNRELCLAYENLKKYENKVDYILTHKYVNYSNSDEYSRMSLEGLTKYLDECVTFKHWYSGHWHGTKYLDDKHTVVYDEPIAIL